jgi:hypothetical protein
VACKLPGVALISSPTPAMESTVPMINNWFSDYDWPDSDHSARSIAAETAHHPPVDPPFAGLSKEDHFQQNLEAMRALLRDETTKHIIVNLKKVGRRVARQRRRTSNAEAAEIPRRGEDGEPTRKLITAPTASGLRSTVMHPMTYRDLPGISSVAALAKALNVAQWSEQVRVVRGHDWVVSTLQRFRNIPSTQSEAVVSAKFANLMSAISLALDITCNPDAECRFGVGGILALGEYAFCGKTDLRFVVNGRSAPLCPEHSSRMKGKVGKSQAQSEATMVLTCEFKTGDAFPYGNTWYHGSRCAQVLGAVWSGWLENAHAPALLLSPRQFKLLVVRNPGNTACACALAEWKNDGRIGLDVHQFPSGYGSGSTDAPEFLETLVLILLATSRDNELRASPDGDPKTPTKSEGVGVEAQHSGDHAMQATPNDKDPPSANRAVRRRSSRKAGGGTQRARPASHSESNPSIWFVPRNVLEEIEIPDNRTSGK